MKDGYIQHVRVSANAAVGANYLAKPDSKVVGMIGSGDMARCFAEAFSAVGNIQIIKAYSSKRANFLKYCHEITEHLGCEVVPVHDPKEALRGAEIGATCTNSYSPVAQGDWLEPGSHIASFMSSELGRTCVLASMRPVLWSTGPLPWRKGSWTMTLAFA